MVYTSAVELLALLRESQINLIPVVEKAFRVEYIVLYLQRELVEAIFCLVLESFRDSFAKQDSINIKKQKIALSDRSPDSESFALPVVGLKR